MAHLVILNLGQGSIATGFGSVTAQLWQSPEVPPIQSVAALPPMPELETTHQCWQRFYRTFYSGMDWRQSRSAPSMASDVNHAFEIEEEDLTVITRAEFAALSETLKQQFQHWLHSDTFRKIDQMLRTQLHPQNDIRLLITADDDAVLKLPWHLWAFLDDYPHAEIALSPANYGRSLQIRPRPSQRQVRILAILGSQEGIDTEADRKFLEQLPRSQITVLVEPDRATLDDQLWRGGWDILFFAGHSSSEGKGYIQINATDQLTIDQLKYGLRTAIAHGLKLAIFNSCDGLGLARDLADLHLPQVIVMREPIPDPVAQEFLKSFLAAFSQGRSLYAAVRQARERLQVWEDYFPCAPWLPVICQNPAEIPPRWQDWCGWPRRRWPRFTAGDLGAIARSSLWATGILLGLRGFGLLQPLELATFDRLMQLRPPELPDPRLLVVRITEADIQAEGTAMRQGSLSDSTLSQMLEILEEAEPSVIGLDLYRDFAASPELTPWLESERLVAICKRPDPESDPTGILPPPEVDLSRLGFSDFIQDADGIVRRHLLFTSPNPAVSCATSYALSVQLAFRHLYGLGILPEFTAQGELKLGSVVFPALGSRAGGYQGIDARGSQLLLNYRATPSPDQVAAQVTVAQLLEGKIDASAIQDRVVLIGVDTPHSGDRWMTPYGRGFNTQLAGVMIHAQMTSHLLSAVLDQRPLLWVWRPWMEWVWIAAWASLASLLAWGMSRPLHHLGAIALLCLFITGLCYLILLQGGWLPWVPAIAGVLLSSGIYRLHRPSRLRSYLNLEEVEER